MLHVGFTGTQRGLTTAQRDSLERLLAHLKALHESVSLHHGDCIGADTEAHRAAVGLGYYVVLHPPLKDDKRSFCKADEERLPLPYLDRNEKIAQACILLIACPKENAEQVRSGTWATVRRARKFGKKIVVIPPGGRFSMEKP